MDCHEIGAGRSNSYNDCLSSGSMFTVCAMSNVGQGLFDVSLNVWTFFIVSVLILILCYVIRD